MRSQRDDLARNQAVSLKGLAEAHPHLRNDAVLLRLALGGNPYAEALLAAEEVERLARRNAETPRSRQALATGLQIGRNRLHHRLREAEHAVRDAPPHPALRDHVLAVTEAALERARERTEQVWRLMVEEAEG